jgi:hypothetical protein
MSIKPKRPKPRLKFALRFPCREKLEKEQPAKIVNSPQGLMLIPRPIDVDALMRKIAKGKLATTAQIREKLAANYKTDIACPMTTGIFMRIAAEAAEEDARYGKKKITPYWRVIKPDGSLNEKFPGGAIGQMVKLKDEGHWFERLKGKKSPCVADFEKRLTKF